MTDQDTPTAAEPEITVEDAGRPQEQPQAEATEQPQERPRAADGKFAPREPADGADAPQDAQERPQGEQGEGDKTKAEPEEGSEEFGKLPEGVRKRIARANRQRDDERRRAAEWENKFTELQGLTDKLRSKLKPGDFDTMEEYEAARGTAPRAADQQPAQRPEYVSALGDLREAVETEAPDLWERASKAEVNITQDMVIALSDHDAPAAALRSLVDNPAEAERISKLPAHKQFAAVLKLRAGAQPQKQPRVTQTDDPPSPIPSRGIVDRPLEKMSTEEFIRARDEEERASGSRFGW